MIREIMNTEKPEDRVTMAIIYTLVLLISTLLLRFLWNESLVKHITTLKPIKSLLDAFLLSVALMIIRGC
jgi:hypothetical protein